METEPPPMRAAFESIAMPHRPQRDCAARPLAAPSNATQRVGAVVRGGSGVRVDDQEGATVMADVQYATRVPKVDMTPIRAADSRFVLDQLGRLSEVEPGSLLVGHLDVRHTGIVGHSMGRAAAAQVVAEDPRFLVGVNLDGTLPEALAAGWTWVCPSCGSRVVVSSRRAICKGTVRQRGRLHTGEKDRIVRADGTLAPTPGRPDTELIPSPIAASMFSAPGGLPPWPRMRPMCAGIASNAQLARSIEWAVTGSVAQRARSNEQVSHLRGGIIPQLLPRMRVRTHGEARISVPQDFGDLEWRHTLRV